MSLDKTEIYMTYVTKTLQIVLCMNQNSLIYALANLTLMIFKSMTGRENLITLESNTIFVD